ncbi:MAG: OsmC family protein [Gemmatimonadales bacterium]
MSDHEFGVRLLLQDGYRFEVQADGAPDFVVDEAAPLGEGAGPNPARLVATAVGHCLASSLLFCLRKARVPVAGVVVDVRGTYRRTERTRLRLGGLSVTLSPGLEGTEPERVARCLEIFEDYCVVTEALREGLPITVDVQTGLAPAV